MRFDFSVKNLSPRRALSFLCLLAFLAAGCSPVPKQVSDEYARESERLLSLGNEAVNSGEYERAAELQEQLQQRGYIGSWELKARLHTAEGEHEKALSTVNEALEMVDSDFILWTQKANILSDLGRYDQSEAAYSKARRCPNVSIGDVDFNEALMSLRRDDPERALELLESVLNNKEANIHHDRAMGMKVRALVLLQRDEDLKKFIEASPEEERSRLWTEAASEFYAQKNADSALSLALKAARMDRTNESALYYIREIRNRVTPSSKGWKLVVRCRRGEMEAMCSFIVVATDPDEGLKFCRELESPGVELLSIESAEQIDLEAPSPEGVYKRSGLAFFHGE